jgi:hypothetical protein
MASWRAESIGIREVLVEIEMDRARAVTRLVRPEAITGPAEVPADVDDPDPGIREACRKLLDGDERGAGALASGHGPEPTTCSPEALWYPARRRNASRGSPPVARLATPRSGVAQW